MAKQNMQSGPPPDYDPELEWTQALLQVQDWLKEYREAKASGDRDRIRRAEELVVAAMLRVAQIHPDPVEKEHWKQRAKDFVKADDKGKEHILEGLGKGLLILLATPFAVAAGAVFAAGAIVYGAGKVIGGIGQVLTFGKLKF
jgi:hypothetical protein